METIFNAENFNITKRARAWQDALCGHYVNVDAKVDVGDPYRGSIETSTYGAIDLSVTAVSRQRISRTKKHLSHIEKDCFYVQMPHAGRILVTQNGTEITTDANTAGLYYASEPYQLDCEEFSRATFLEIPRSDLEAQFDGVLPNFCSFDLNSGIGRILRDFSQTLVTESAGMAQAMRDSLSGELLGVVALAIRSSQRAAGTVENDNSQSIRLQTIMRYINLYASNPALTPAKIAKDNGISVRYLHQIFRQNEQSVSNTLRKLRLQRSYDALIASAPNQRITDIAFENGFNSSSHFSNLFRDEFDLSPRDILQRN